MVLASLRRGLFRCRHSRRRLGVPVVTTLSGDRVRMIGVVLFGELWRAPFEDEFGISPRNLRRVIAGSDEISGDMAIAIEQALRDHGQKLDQILELFV